MREGHFSDYISDEIELEAPSIEFEEMEKKESKPKVESPKKDTNDSFLKEPQPTSSLTQDQPRETFSKKRHLSSSPSCAEKADEQNSTQKTQRIKSRKKKKKKRSSIIKRIFLRFK